MGRSRGHHGSQARPHGDMGGAQLPREATTGDGGHAEPRCPTQPLAGRGRGGGSPQSPGTRTDARRRPRPSQQPARPRLGRSPPSRAPAISPDPPANRGRGCCQGIDGQAAGRSADHRQARPAVLGVGGPHGAGLTHRHPRGWSPRAVPGPSGRHPARAGTSQTPSSLPSEAPAAKGDREFPPEFSSPEQ